MLTTYLVDIRRRLMICCGCYGVLFLAFFYWQNQLLQWLLKPLLQALHATDFIVATHIASPVLAPLHVASVAAWCCCLPLLLIQIWQFIRPALYVKEQRWIKWVGSVSCILFLSGMFFCFYAVLPFMFHLFSSMTPLGVHYFPELSAAVIFTIKMLILFGMAFQLPLVTVILVRSKLMTYQTLKTMRPYVIIIAFIIGMLLTPPDVMSQILLAVPLCLLYELGMLFLYCTSA